MISKINFDLSEDNSPVIVAEIRMSDDVRDKIAKRFLETFAYESNLCWVSFIDGVSIIEIAPMSPENVRAAIEFKPQDIGLSKL